MNCLFAWVVVWWWWVHCTTACISISQCSVGKQEGIPVQNSTPKKPSQQRTPGNKIIKKVYVSMYVYNVGYLHAYIFFTIVTPSSFPLTSFSLVG